jgi:hypothetical protein
MVVVRIEKPGNMTLAAWFIELRSWFDNNDCTPLLFSRAGQVTGRVLFNIRFAEDSHPLLFTSHFSKHEPSIQRSTGGETNEVKDGP